MVSALAAIAKYGFVFVHISLPCRQPLHPYNMASIPREGIAGGGVDMDNKRGCYHLLYLRNNQPLMGEAKVGGGRGAAG